MKRKIDNTLKGIITRSIDDKFKIVDNDIEDVFNEETIGGSQLKQYLIDCFAIDDDLASLITHEWLYINGQENIEDNWPAIKQYSDIGRGDWMIEHGGVDWAYVDHPASQDVWINGSSITDTFITDEVANGRIYNNGYDITISNTGNTATILNLDPNWQSPSE